MMSDLARDFFSDNPMLAGPLIAMLLFTAVFVAACVRVIRANRDHVDRMAQMPLDLEGETEVHHG